MRIAIISHLKYPIAEPFAGGLEMHTHLLARHLIARGHEVTLFAAEGSDPSLGLRAVSPATGTPDTPLAAEGTALQELAVYHAIMDEIAVGGFDLLHNNSLHYQPLLEASRVAAPMITTFHCPPFMEMENGVVERSGRDMRFVAISGTARRMWEGIVTVDAVIPNGIDLGTFQPRLGPTTEPHAIWFGRLVPEKGAHLAIAAARRAGMKLRIAGPMNDMAYWREHVAPALGTDVTYIGHLGHAALSRAVAEASVAVITPRWEEPYGLVVAEALACGTPIAGFARGALPDLTDATTGCLVPADDVDALAVAIPAAAALSRAACRARAEAICDVRAMVDAYEALYRREVALRVTQPGRAG